MKRLIVLLFAISLTALWSCGGNDPQPSATPLDISVPDRFPQLPDLSDNPPTVEGVALGRKLFYDPILSRDSTQSCASCHLQSQAFTDPARFSTGIRGEVGTRHAMALINLVWQDKDLFWDARSSSLEHQALIPIEDPLEMDASWEEIEARLQAHIEYSAQAEEIFGVDKITRTEVTKALAQFEYTLISADSKYDRFRKDLVEFSESERRGWNLFFTEKAECFHCHGPPLFTDGVVHNNGLDATLTDLGKGGVTGVESDKGLFRTPTLRNTAMTAPYMHDGRFNTLEEVLDHYSDHVAENSPNLDPLIKPFRLSAQEKADLIAFLKTLTDSTFIQEEAFSSPF